MNKNTAESHERLSTLGVSTPAIFLLDWQSPLLVCLVLWKYTSAEFISESHSFSQGIAILAATTWGNINLTYVQSSTYMYMMRCLTFLFNKSNHTITSSFPEQCLRLEKQKHAIMFIIKCTYAGFHQYKASVVCDLAWRCRSHIEL